MRLSMRAGKRNMVLIGALLSLLAVVLPLKNHFSGKVREVALPYTITEEIDELRLDFPDHSFLILKKQPDGGWEGISDKESFKADKLRVEDFLSLFNTWEIIGIPTDSQSLELRRRMERQAGKILLKGKKRSLFRASFMLWNDAFWIKRRYQPLCMVGMPYRTLEWMRFFEPGAAQWKNRQLMPFNYTDIFSVGVDYPEGLDSYRIVDAGAFYRLEYAQGVDTVPVAVAQAYLSAFGGIYFDFRNGKSGVGRFLYGMRICSRAGVCADFRVFEKDTDGHPDLFKALVVVRHSQMADTVEMPYVVLDKLAKTSRWFR